MELKKNKDLLQMAEEDITRLEKENSVSYSNGHSAHIANMTAQGNS